jgi:hypothetical protein
MLPYQKGTEIEAVCFSFCEIDSVHGDFCEPPSESSINSVCRLCFGKIVPREHASGSKQYLANGGVDATVTLAALVVNAFPDNPNSPSARLRAAARRAIFRRGDQHLPGIRREGAGRAGMPARCSGGACNVLGEEKDSMDSAREEATLPLCVLPCVLALFRTPAWTSSDHHPDVLRRLAPRPCPSPSAKSQIYSFLFVPWTGIREEK